VANQLRGLSWVAFIFSLLPLTALAQRDRLSGPIDSRRTVVLPGNLHPSAQRAVDEGPVDPLLRMSLITLALQPSAGQQADLEQLLKDQQDPLSPNYHRWLTPEQYADRFGFSAGDISRIASWLQSGGLTVDDISRGRNWIVFSGTAAAVRDTFHTEIHRYRFAGEPHFANVAEPSVPAVLAPLIMGLRGLHDFRLKPAGLRTTAELGSGEFAQLAPDDVATIYDIAPLYKAGFDGSGQKVAIAGQTDVDLADIRAFRSKFNLSANDPQMVLVAGSPDPGLSPDDLPEADADLELSGAVARNATIVFVYATDVGASQQYAISQNLAPVLSLSYGVCEQQLPGSTLASLRALAQQANVQGITFVAASGDSGAADCDPSFDPGTSAAMQGLAVDNPASIPEVTAVGGTEINEYNIISVANRNFSTGTNTYWATSNGPNGGSALSWIPEVGWNESARTGIFLSGGVYSGLRASGGGLSKFYPKPSWQTGPGVPSANARAVPDVSLTAAQHDPYACVTGGTQVGCLGTSTSAPTFAGLLALLNQYQVSNGFQPQPGMGNINPNLYSLAQNTQDAFHDVTAGNNIVACAQASPDCSSGTFGYSAGPGYDLVTGLGSVDANILITEWNNRQSGSTTTLTANPATLGLNDTTQVTATVAAAGTAGLPTGTVDFTLGPIALGSSALVNSGGNAVASIAISGTKLNFGVFVIVAHYRGSNGINGSANTIALTVARPVPVISSLSPSSATPGGAGFTLTVNGTNFVSGSVVQWNGDSFNGSMATAGGTQLTAFIPSSEILHAGTAQVTVSNPPPGGGVSNSVSFVYTGSPGPPSFLSTGIVNGAAFNQAGSGISPGMIASIFGSNLSNAPSAGVQPGLVPGTSMQSVNSNGTSVTFGGVPAPLLFVSPTQLNVQVPFEVSGKASVQVVVSVGGSNSTPVTASVFPATPGLFTLSSDGFGLVVALNQDGTLNALLNPAQVGSVVQLFATGLGAVSPAVATGGLAPTVPPLAVSTPPPTVTIDNVPANVQFSGLAPGFAGLWQVNVLVPSLGGTGRNTANLPLVLAAGGRNANAVALWVKY